MSELNSSCPANDGARLRPFTLATSRPARRPVGKPSCPAKRRGGIQLGRLLLTVAALTLSAPADIPPPPQSLSLIHDLAGIVNEADEQSLSNLQEQVFQQCRVPIVVVTIAHMRDYDPGSPSIESFARRWFDTWGIGSQERNNGMLVLVSSGDRKARIELGADWGRRFDGFCRQLMDKKMVPQFKKGSYSAGLKAAVSSLGELAKAGPRAEPPNAGLTARFLDSPALRFATQHNPIAEKGGTAVLTLMILAGLGCFVAAYFLPADRKPLVILGIILIALAVLFWVVLIIFFLWGSATGRIPSSGGGGGAFSGGSSGGGGASGSW